MTRRRKPFKVVSVSPEMSRLLDDLKTYCEQKRGRKAQVARTLGMLPSGLSNFLAKRSEPTGSQTLKILKILETRK